MLVSIQFDAAERGIDVGIPWTEPVAKRRAKQLMSGDGRRALHHEMLPIEKISRVFGIRRHGLKPWKRLERGGGPLPAVADKILHAPCARSGGTTSSWDGIKA